jgi:hypothetical protein
VTGGSSATTASGGTTSGSSGSAASGGSSGPTDAATGSDAASTGKVTCATAAPAGFDGAKIGAFEEMTIGPDGTIYWSGNNAPNIGRWKPPYDAAPEKGWAKTPAINGIKLDPKIKAIYAGSRGIKKLIRVSTEDPTKIDNIADVEGGINGLTLADDGAVFYTDEAGGNVYRVAADGTKNQVTTTKITGANDIAFSPDGKLCVNAWVNPGAVTCIKLDATFKEAAGSREEYAKFSKGNGDGIAFDKAGNMYAVSGALWKVTPDKVITQVDPAGGSGIEFGAGALPCNLLFWASGANSKTVDNPGMEVPWHRQ